MNFARVRNLPTITNVTSRRNFIVNDDVIFLNIKSRRSVKVSFLSPGIRWCWMVLHTSAALHPGNNLCYSMNRRVDRSVNQYGHSVDGRNTLLLQDITS
jgi:hypothetical protein